ncbi:MAG: siphovirus Gp157 family protein [Aureibaculum sp.]|nr:siphovirus Gp157 family protein [Aureibaculum sp.]
MKNIYEIEQNYLALVEQIEANEGELTPELEQALEINQKELEVKSLRYVQVMKTIDGETSLIDAEIKRLQALKKARVNVVSRLKETISQAMKLYEVDEIVTPLVKINFRKSKSVVISDIEALPANCKIIETKPISKTEIKKMIESGTEVSGASIVENQNLQIK